MKITDAQLKQIYAHAKEIYPAECCGALIGRIDGDTKAVVELAPAIIRRTDDPHRYLIAPEDLRRLEAQARTAGQEIVGYYHSHPDHPARPSAFDAEHAWPWYSYLIVRIDQGRGTDMASWVLDDDRPQMHSEALDVLSEV